MFRTIAFVIILFTTTVEAGGPLHTSDPTRSFPADPPIETTVAGIAFSTLPADEQAIVLWARGRFIAAGLELPPMTIRFDPSKATCGHNEGLYRYSDKVHQVTICVRDTDSFAAHLERRRTLLHEFAHAWETVNLNNEDRTELNERFGVSAWNHPNDTWGDRGAEVFAETFVFGLLDQARRQPLLNIGCHDLAASFTAVTGVAPLGPDQPWCVET